MLAAKLLVITRFMLHKGKRIYDIAVAHLDVSNHRPPAISELTKTAVCSVKETPTVRISRMFIASAKY